MCVHVCVDVDYYRTKEDTLPVCVWETHARVDSFNKQEKITNRKLLNRVGQTWCKKARAFHCMKNTQ